jgi:hypothetical protein
MIRLRWVSRGRMLSLRWRLRWRRVDCTHRLILAAFRLESIWHRGPARANATFRLPPARPLPESKRNDALWWPGLLPDSSRQSKFLNAGPAGQSRPQLDLWASSTPIVSRATRTHVCDQPCLAVSLIFPHPDHQSSINDHQFFYCAAGSIWIGVDSLTIGCVLPATLVCATNVTTPGEFALREI